MLTIKDVSTWLNIKPSTLYLWASHGKIPCRRIHGLIRFEPDAIQTWLKGFGTSPGKPLQLPTSHNNRDIDQLIAVAKAALYTPRCEKPDQDRAKQGGRMMALFRRNRVWWMGFSYGGKQVRRSTEVSEKKLAEKIYHKVMTQIAEGKWYEPEKGTDKTVKELLERYLRDHSAPNKAPKSHRSDKSASLHLSRAFGNLTLRELRPSLIAAHKAKRRTEGAAAKTINIELGILSNAFQLAVKEWEW